MNHLLKFLPRFTTLLVVLFLGLLIGKCFTPMNEMPAGDSHDHASSAADSSEAKAPELWTCSMHPAIQAPKPGDCPICGMDLIPFDGGGASSHDGPRTLRLEEGQKAIAGIRTTPVVKREIAHTVRLVGKLAIDETALATLSAWVGGRLDRLYVDYTGLKVRAGDHMAEIYSPQLFHAQEELIVAVESAKRFGLQSDESLQKISHSTVVAARKKLALYGLTEEQMQEIVDLGEPSEQITLSAPMGGTVIHRNAVEGQYVKEGDPLYTIADLKHLWLEIDAYESDMPWMRYGQEVVFEVDAWPGETFRGAITFIDPVLDPMTRTVHLRVDVDNAHNKLRPEMFARVKVQTMVVGAGQPSPVDLSGMWMCPMHPEIIDDTPGECPICAMALETTESLGFAGESESSELPLLIPVTAPLLTGDRALVFVEIQGSSLHEATIFEARDIVLGPRAGEFFVVKEGLEEGELVVSRGAFTIDSELQLRGKPSMMAPDGGGGGGGHAGMPGMGGPPAAGGSEMGDQQGTDHSQMDMSDEQASAEFKNLNGKLLMNIADLGEALASDDFSTAKKVANFLQETLSAMSETEAPMSAKTSLEALGKATLEATSSSEIEALRIAFSKLQAPSMQLSTRFGYSGLERELSVFHCPMALGDGADWIDFKGDSTRNPYYGASMLKCGDETNAISGFDKQ